MYIMPLWQFDGVHNLWKSDCTVGHLFSHNSPNSSVLYQAYNSGLSPDGDTYIQIFIGVIALVFVTFNIIKEMYSILQYFYWD
jgi:hypothetical protein